jgi:hypothetical protein
MEVPRLLFDRGESLEQLAKDQAVEERQQEYDDVIRRFYSFYDFGDDTRNDIEQEIIDILDSEQHKDAFASFLAGYKYACYIATGKEFFSQEYKGSE